MWEKKITANLLSSLKAIWIHRLLQDGLLICASQSPFQVNAVIAWSANIDIILIKKSQKWSADSTDLNWCSFLYLPRCHWWFRICVGNCSWKIPWLHAFVVNKSLCTGSCSKRVTECWTRIKIWITLRLPVRFKWLAALWSAPENCEIYQVWFYLKSRKIHCIFSSSLIHSLLWVTQIKAKSEDN